jgi:hypothetical protein
MSDSDAHQASGSGALNVENYRLKRDDLDVASPIRLERTSASGAGVVDRRAELTIKQRRGRSRSVKIETESRVVFVELGNTEPSYVEQYEVRRNSSVPDAMKSRELTSAAWLVCCGRLPPQSAISSARSRLTRPAGIERPLPEPIHHSRFSLPVTHRIGGRD